MSRFIDTHHAAIDLDDEGIATLTLTNAKSMNILGTPAILEWTAALDALRARGDIRALILRGTGDKAFIGGADIHEMSNLTPATAEAFITRLGALCESVRTFPAPTIARMAGYTLGGGLEVALACDLRIASTDSHYGMPEVMVGVPSVIHAVLLPRLIGGSRAAWMLMTGETIGADKALDWGLVHELHEGNGLDERIMELARRFLSLGPEVLKQQKRLMRSWETTTPEAAIAATIPEFGRAFATGEPQRYMGAFKSRKR
jgi:enoyl-CoA hydratase/carnithine racemase